LFVMSPTVAPGLIMEKVTLHYVKEREKSERGTERMCVRECVSEREKVCVSVFRERKSACVCVCVL